MRVLASLFVAVTACGSRQPASRPLPTTAPYLMLFEVGRSWTFPAQNGPVTCKVTESKHVGDASVSHVNCGSLLVSGTWVATPAGLYHPYLPIDEPDELALLTDDDLLISAIPADREHDHGLAGGAQDSVEAFGFQGSWCVRQTTQSATDRRTYTLCFDGTNITGGGDETVSPTETHRTSFGDAPPSPVDHDSRDDD